MPNKIKTFLELSVIQNFAPTVLNRDQANLPKETWFGGTRRARVSSQSWKRAVRENEVFTEIVGEEHIGDRTKNVVRYLIQCLQAQDAQKFADTKRLITVVTKFVSCYVSGADGNAIDPKSGESYKTTVQLFFSKQEIDWLLEQLQTNWDDLQAPLDDFVKLIWQLDQMCEARELKDKEAAEKAKSLVDSKKPTKIKKSKEEEDLEKKIGKDHSLSKLLDEMAKNAIKKAAGNRSGIKKSVVNAADIALFGRMVASNTDLNVDAACQYGQSISTHTVQMETDFFSAVDDLHFPGDQGSDHLGQQDYNGSCYYRYTRVDLGQLLDNLGYPDEKNKERNKEILDLAHKTIEGFARAFLESVPKAKQSSHDNNAEPTFALAVIRNRGRAWSLANAFERPIPTQSREGFLIPSIKRLDEHWGRVRGHYDDPKESTLRAAYLINLLDKECETPNLSEKSAAGKGVSKVENVTVWAKKIADDMLNDLNSKDTQAL